MHGRKLRSFQNARYMYDMSTQCSVKHKGVCNRMRVCRYAPDLEPAERDAAGMHQYFTLSDVVLTSHRMPMQG